MGKRVAGRFNIDYAKDFKNIDFDELRDKEEEEEKTEETDE